MNGSQGDTGKTGSRGWAGPRVSPIEIDEARPTKDIAPTATSESFQKQARALAVIGSGARPAIQPADQASDEADRDTAYQPEDDSKAQAVSDSVSETADEGSADADSHRAQDPEEQMRGWVA